MPTRSGRQQPPKSAVLAICTANVSLSSSDSWNAAQLLLPLSLGKVAGRWNGSREGSCLGFGPSHRHPSIPRSSKRFDENTGDACDSRLLESGTVRPSRTWLYHVPGSWSQANGVVNPIPAGPEGGLCRYPQRVLGCIVSPSRLRCDYNTVFPSAPEIGFLPFLRDPWRGNHHWSGMKEDLL